MNLIIKSLNFSYQSEEVFKDLNLNFNSGILNLVSGPSGSGKTTLLNLIAGLEKPSSGLIMLDDDVQSSNCLLYTSPSPRDAESSRMPSSA